MKTMISNLFTGETAEQGIEENAERNTLREDVLIHWWRSSNNNQNNYKMTNKEAEI